MGDELTAYFILKSDSAVELMRNIRNKNPYHNYMDKLPESEVSLYEFDSDYNMDECCKELNLGYSIDFHTDHGIYMGVLFYYKPEALYVALQLSYMKLTGIIKSGSCEQLIDNVFGCEWEDIGD